MAFDRLPQRFRTLCGKLIIRVEDFPPDKWDAIIAINLSSAFHTTRLAVPAMKRGKWGRIINTASAHSLIASPNKSAYVTHVLVHEIGHHFGLSDADMERIEREAGP